MPQSERHYPIYLVLLTLLVIWMIHLLPFSQVLAFEMSLPVLLGLWTIGLWILVQRTLDTVSVLGVFLVVVWVRVWIFLPELPVNPFLINFVPVFLGLWVFRTVLARNVNGFTFMLLCFVIALLSLPGTGLQVENLLIPMLIGSGGILAWLLGKGLLEAVPTAIVLSLVFIALSYGVDTGESEALNLNPPDLSVVS